MRSILGIILGVIFGAVGAVLFTQSLPAKEGSLKARAEKAEFERQKAEQEIEELEVAEVEVLVRKLGDRILEQ